MKFIIELRLIGEVSDTMNMKQGENSSRCFDCWSRPDFEFLVQ